MRTCKLFLFYSQFFPLNFLFFLSLVKRREFRQRAILLSFLKFTFLPHDIINQKDLKIKNIASPELNTCGDLPKAIG
jgi:hypothetical protein